MSTKRGIRLPCRVGGVANDWVVATAGKHKGISSSVEMLKSIGLRIPRSGRFTIVVKPNETGKYRVHNTSMRRVTHARFKDPFGGRSARFCYLPASYVGKRVDITVEVAR